MSKSAIVAKGITESEAKEQRVALVCFIIHKLKSKGSWCSLLHVQKAYYMVQEMLDISLGYKFVPYKYGPYCFQLTDDIDVARENLLIYADETSPKYGLSYRLAKDVIKDLQYKDNNGYEYKEKVNFIVDWFGNKQGRELELLTSVYMIINNIEKDSNAKKQIDKLQDWKPHFSEEAIKEAIKEVRLKEKEVTQEFLS